MKLNLGFLFFQLTMNTRTLFTQTLKRQHCTDSQVSFHFMQMFLFNYNYRKMMGRQSYSIQFVFHYMYIYQGYKSSCVSRTVHWMQKTQNCNITRHHCTTHNRTMWTRTSITGAVFYLYDQFTLFSTLSLSLMYSCTHSLLFLFSLFFPGFSDTKFWELYAWTPWSIFCSKKTTTKYMRNSSSQYHRPNNHNSTPTSYQMAKHNALLLQTPRQVKDMALCFYYY